MNLAAGACEVTRFTDSGPKEYASMCESEVVYASLLTLRESKDTLTDTKLWDVYQSFACVCAVT